MPNHVTNILKIIGDEKTVKEIMDSLKSNESPLDFNKIHKMPEELKNTSNPVNVVTEKEYQKELKKYKKKQENDTLKHWETLPITEKMQEDLIKKYGTDNWYDWSVNNWGTKWNAYDVYVLSDNQIQFSTAWATPTILMERLSMINPDVEIEISYADEDTGSNVGIYKLNDGAYTYTKIPKQGSLEAIEMAIDIKGEEEYFFDEYISYIEENDLTNDYISKLIELTHKKGKLHESYPIYVLNVLKEMALDDEQYERVAEIQKFMEKIKI